MFKREREERDIDLLLNLYHCSQVNFDFEKFVKFVNDVY